MSSDYSSHNSRVQPRSVVTTSALQQFCFCSWKSDMSRLLFLRMFIAGERHLWLQRCFSLLERRLFLQVARINYSCEVHVFSCKCFAVTDMAVTFVCLLSCNQKWKGAQSERALYTIIIFWNSCSRFCSVPCTNIFFKEALGPGYRRLSDMHRECYTVES